MHQSKYPPLLTSGSSSLGNLNTQGLVTNMLFMTLLKSLEMRVFRRGWFVQKEFFFSRESNLPEETLKKICVCLIIF